MIVEQQPAIYGGTESSWAFVEEKPSSWMIVGEKMEIELEGTTILMKDSAHVCKVTGGSEYPMYMKTSM
jgi:hypothetical protein